MKVSGKHIQRVTASVAAVVLLAGFATQMAAANMIGIDVGSDRESPAMSPTDTAGVVSQANWNLAPLNGGTSDIAGPTVGVVVDNTGATLSGVSATWYGDKGNDTWSASNSFSGGDAKMMYGYLDTGYNAYDPGNEYVSFTGLGSAYTAGGYDVYVYLRKGGAVQLNATSATSTPIFYFSSISNPSSFVQATSTTSTSPAAADYALFTGLTASHFKVSSFSGVIAGVQVVTTPEPASLALLAIGGLLIISRKHRARVRHG